MEKATAKKTEEVSSTEMHSSRQCRGPQELSRLELECMRAIWLGGPSTVHDVQEFLSPSRPLAYTTVMTILDRLAHKGAVTRRKKGKAYLYVPALELEDSRKVAVWQLIDFYFDGSSRKLKTYLDGENLPETSARDLSPIPEKSSPENIPQIQDCLL